MMVSEIRAVPTVEDFTEAIEECIRTEHHGDKAGDGFYIAMELNHDATLVGWVRFSEEAISPDASDTWIRSMDGDDKSPSTHLAELENGDRINKNLHEAARKHPDVFLSAVPKFDNTYGVPSGIDHSEYYTEDETAWDVEFVFVLRRRPE